MRINELSDDILNELSFMGSQCTRDCSGHRAGYKWSLDRGGVENPASPSQSFINGSNIGHRQVQQNKQKRTQGGGKITGYQSQTANAVRKRQARAQAKVDQGMHGTPMDESSDLGSTIELLHDKMDMKKLLSLTKPHLTSRQWFALMGYLQGMSNKEIGQEMGVGAQTAYTHLVYALSGLKSVARKHGFTNDPASEYDNWKLRKNGNFSTNKPLPPGVDAPDLI